MAHRRTTWGYRTRSETELRELSANNTLVAIEDGILIGFAVWTPRTNDGSCIYSDNDRILEVLDLFVTRSQRGQGTGRALLQAVEAQAKMDGFTKLLVYSSVREIDPVPDFYRSSGFRSWGIQLFKKLDE